MMKEIKSKLEFKAIFVMLHCYKSHPDKNIRESLVHTTLRKHVIQTGNFQIKAPPRMPRDPTRLVYQCIQRLKSVDFRTSKLPLAVFKQKHHRTDYCEFHGARFVPSIHHL